MRLRWLILGVLLLLAGGAAAAFAATVTTGTVSACATTPAQTISDNGTPIATVPEAAACTTVTYTVPTVTETVTGTTATTVPTTTTAPTTTTTSSDPTYDSEIAYTQTRPAFTPTRTINVSSAAALKSAISNLQAGDLVKATAPFTVPGETVISRKLSAPAVLDLGSYVTFSYTAGSNVPAVYLNRSTNLRIYGGTATTNDTGGPCILSHGGLSNVVWWGFYAHDCGNSGLSLFPVPDGGAFTNNDFQGEITKVGQHIAFDNHTEKGSGFHCANLDDNGDYTFSGNRFALYCHDIPTGAAIQYGTDGPVAPVNNTIILKAVNLTFVSKIQTGGNAIQFWGVNGQTADIKYLEVENAQGYALFDGGMYSGTTLKGVTVEYGRASKTNLNPRYAGKDPWQTDRGVAYRDVQPAP